MEPGETKVEILEETGHISQECQDSKERLINLTVHHGVSRDGLSKMGSPYNPTLICRLCAVAKESETDDLNEWIKISDKWLNTSETIDTVMKRCSMNRLIAQFPNEIPFVHICTTCHISLQQVQVFIDKITDGQEKLKKLLGEKEKLVEGVQNHAKPRKRGRPRKDDKSKTVTTLQTECPVNIIKERVKRTSRRPDRYGGDLYVDDTSKIVNREVAVVVISKTDAKLESNAIETGTLNSMLIQNSMSKLTTSAATKCTLSDINTKSKREGGDIDNFIELKPPTGSQDQNQEHENSHIDSDNASLVNDNDDANFNLRFYKRERKRPRMRKRGRPRKERQTNFRCKCCQKVYTAYASLVYHQLSAHSELAKNFTCTLCKKVFAHRALLTNHMFTHSSVRPYICDEDNCKASFKSRGSLYNHKKSHRKDKEKLFTCDKCGLQFALKLALKTHYKIHSEEKSYACIYCDKAFSHSGNMKEHVRTHTKEKPYSCNILDCVKKFTTSSQLRNHKMTHLDKKPFLCVDCGKSFSQRAGLIVHMKSHKGGLKACCICHKEFADPSGLRKHLRIHTGERPFKCEICNKAFSDPSNYAKHKYTHPEYKLTAEICTTRIDDSCRTTSPVSLASTVELFSATTDKTVDGSNSVVTTRLENQNDVSTNETQDNDMEPLVQILSEEELTTLNAGVSSNNGNIIFIYQPNELIPVAVESHSITGSVPTGDETIFIEEVVEIGESSLSQES